MMEEYTPINRRKFISRAFWGGVGISFLSSFTTKELLKHEIIKITILHTNDMHSHIEPFSANDPKYPNLGGMARRSSLIKNIRKESPNVLLLDAGDVFQGTPYFNFYGGEPEYKLMSEMGYDAGTVGNHDLDNGLEGLVKVLPNAKFPLINCNYDFSDTIMDRHTIPYKIYSKNGIKIGVFGLGVELSGLVAKKNYGNTVYINPVEKAAQMSHLLKMEKACDLVVCLSHLGYSYKTNKISDKTLAKQSKNIDIIIGGHSHTFLDTPMSYKNREGKEILVCQVGWGGIRLGRIDYFFISGKKEKNIISSSVEVNNKGVMATSKK